MVHGREINHWARADIDTSTALVNHNNNSTTYLHDKCYQVVYCQQHRYIPVNAWLFWTKKKHLIHNNSYSFVFNAPRKYFKTTSIAVEFGLKTITGQIRASRTPYDHNDILAGVAHLLMTVPVLSYYCGHPSELDQLNFKCHPPKNNHVWSQNTILNKLLDNTLAVCGFLYGIQSSIHLSIYPSIYRSIWCRWWWWVRSTWTNKDTK